MQTINRIHNFNPGPATLPVSVLFDVQKEFLNYKDTGMSILETSHRSKPYEEMQNQVKSDLLELMGLGDDYDVLFIQGGASLQFAMIPMNFATPEKKGSYVLSGSFASKAYKEAELLGVGSIAASSKDQNFSHVPTQDELNIDPNSAYVHICSNNTIYGTEYHYIPETNGIPLIADMSSNILSRPMDFSKFDMIYAGVQKNLGPAGVVVVIAKKSLIEKSPENIPTMLRYDTFAKNNSLYNTPPTFTIYFVGKVLQWIKNEGGLAEMQTRNERKANLIYKVIDESNGFYIGHAEKESRSTMNVTFNLQNEDLEKKFIAESIERKLNGLKGHRSVGGIRASIYNAMPYDGAVALAMYMDSFRKRNA